MLGITRKAYEANAYALLLKVKNGQRILPLVVGVSEAQAIAVRLEGVMLPRPITPDLMVSVFHAFGIMPERVEIYDFDGGVFYARLHLLNRETELGLEARPSDAVAIALRTGAPIFTTSQLLDKAGYVPGEDGMPQRETETTPIEALPVARLQQLLNQAVENEQYERAAEIQKIIASKMA